jgi:alpha-glucosidase (family GH31 glycosyl hydrolase)
MTAQAFSGEMIGSIRVQPLTETLFRIEQKGPGGFEDSPTFTIVNRAFTPVEYQVEKADGRTRVSTAAATVSVPDNAQTLRGIQIELSDGSVLKKLSARIPRNTNCPAPSDLPDVWILADSPRVVPPAQGALPPPEGPADPHSGWNLTNHAVDVYVFLPRISGYETYRRDFLQLTGSIPLPPLYTFGIWYSRYHPYSEETALEVIDKFRSKHIPLDVFVVDTDWRVGASCGYGINTDLFPDMERFLTRAHEKQVRLMFNDHPEPVGDCAVDPKELTFREEGLHSLLALGADAWWFDRNWHTHLHHLTDGLNKEVWGMKLYHDITLDFRPDSRPLIMSNVDGINNGHYEYPTHPAAHRYPIWWTGDTLGTWEYLERGIENGMNCGINGFLPYVNEDLGGHIGHIDAEFYIRFVQFGVFSPVTRLHCTCNHSRYPWQYGPETESVVREYFRLRMRLLPMIYSAARQAWRDGTPLMRRCDLEWPGYPAAADTAQYLFGDDLLVAPIAEKGGEDGSATTSVWIPEGDWMNLWNGHTVTGPETLTVDVQLEQIPLFVRLGGIIVNTPTVETTQEMDWSCINLDIYLPAGDCETVRTLYEDDGISNRYLDGNGGLTTLRLSKTGRRITLAIEPSNQLNAFQSEQRKWMIRFHRPDSKEVIAASINGRPATGDEIKNLAATGPATVSALFSDTPAGQTEITITNAAAKPMELEIKL